MQSASGNKVKFEVRCTHTYFTEGVDPVEHFRVAVEEIVTLVVGEAAPEDLVGFTFCNQDFKDKRPGWYRFQEAQSVRMESLWSLLSAVYQSNSVGLDTSEYMRRM